jgi:vanillate O-demethylase monooxygenase subunit
LDAKPVEVTLCGVELVLYRTDDGRVAALAGRCPHRKMRLALGQVEGDCIVCPYHGWTFRPDGSGISPATPNMKITTTCYQVREQSGAIWLRASGSDAALPPSLDFPDYLPLALLHHRVAAPFQLLIDNMAELEHTASVHSVFGFDAKNLHQIKTTMTATESELDIYYEGPQRKFPVHLAIPTEIQEGDRFVQYAKVRFGPVHAIYDLEWWKPGKEARRPLQLKFVIFFNPVTNSTCEQYAFVFAKTSSLLLASVLKVFRRILVKSIDRELRADIRLVESLCLTPEQYGDYLLSRCDPPIRKAAAMIDSLYFQRKASKNADFHEMAAL